MTKYTDPEVGPTVARRELIYWLPKLAKQRRLRKEARQRGLNPDTCTHEEALSAGLDERPENHFVLEDLERKCERFAKLAGWSWQLAT
ncbi:MAG: hypothetical protein R3E76_14780 [Planctomycetota bacterium]